jgi:putative inorganic carbon (HCO3(-)) transporter
VATSLSATDLTPVTAKKGAEAPGKVFYYLLLVHAAITVMTLGSRIPGLGIIRPTLLLVAVIWGWWFAVGIRTDQTSGVHDPWGKRLVILLVYSIVTLPFTMWPGSVLREGLPTFIRVASFLFFIIFLCTTWQRLRVFVFVWMGCEMFRVLQPLVMHLTTGYWGDSTYLGGGEFMGRLAGAPGDIVNPNGLGFIVASVLPFLHYYGMSQRRWIMKLAFIAVLVALLYAVVLTASRSSVLAVMVDVLFIAWRSKHRVTVFSIIAVGMVIAFNLMSDDLVDRYVSLVSSNTKNANNAKTAHGRMAAMVEDFELGLERPVFGFGLGTSKEANWNMRHDRYIAHNMYAEVLIELGLVGLGIFISFLAAIGRCMADCARFLARAPPSVEGYAFMQWLTSALRVWFPMAIVFFFAQYGLREADWYIIGGVAAALYALAKAAATSPEEVAAAAQPQRSALQRARSAMTRVVPKRIE